MENVRLACLTLTSLLCVTLSLQRASGQFQLTIVHNNDVHAHFDEIDAHYSDCSKNKSIHGLCFGGEARRNWFIKGQHFTV